MLTLLQPRVEAEVAFGWPGTSTRPTRTRSPSSWCGRRSRCALPALEIVDSRIENWDIKFTDTVADNASSGLYVVGRDGKRLDDLEPRDVADVADASTARCARSGNGAACLGDPLEALRWLAVQCHRFGDPLRAGHLSCPGRWARSSRSPRRPGRGLDQRVRHR